jgi:hypothetical protein
VPLKLQSNKTKVLVFLLVMALAANAIVWIPDSKTPNGTAEFP